MIFSYDKIIKFSKNKKIEKVDLQVPNIEPKFCCKEIKAVIGNGLLKIDEIYTDEKDISSKSLIIGFPTVQDKNNMLVKINNCPMCGEKFEYKLLDTLEYDKRN